MHLPRKTVGIFGKTVHPFLAWVCGMHVHEKVCIHFEKLQNR